MAEVTSALPKAERAAAEVGVAEVEAAAVRGVEAPAEAAPAAGVVSRRHLVSWEAQGDPEEAAAAVPGGRAGSADSGIVEAAAWGEAVRTPTPDSSLIGRACLVIRCSQHLLSGSCSWPRS